MNKNLRPDELVELIRSQSVQLVDVRGPGEYAAGHLPGAINIPLEQVESRLDDLQREGEVVLVCQGGTRAGMACELLANHREKLHVLEGGTTAWVNDGYKVVANTRTRWSLERQTRLGAGLLVLTGVILGSTVSPQWFLLSGFVGLGLTFAGLTNICLMGIVLARTPWNQPRCSTPAAELSK